MKVIKAFFAGYNKTGTIKTWAYLAIPLGMALLAIGVLVLIFHYANIQLVIPEGSSMSQMSPVSGWILAIIGTALYMVGTFGVKFPKKAKATKRSTVQPHKIMG